MKLDELLESQGGRYASQAYWNALKTLRDTWHKLFGEDLPTVGSRAKDAFEQAIAQVEQRLRSDSTK